MRTKETQISKVANGLMDEWDKLIADRLANLPLPCEHDFGGWRQFEDGRGGEQFCQKCGYGAMAWSMRMLP